MTPPGDLITALVTLAVVVGTVATADAADAHQRRHRARRARHRVPPRTVVRPENRWSALAYQQAVLAVEAAELGDLDLAAAQTALGTAYRDLAREVAG